jgi:hypothetical protein
VTTPRCEVAESNCRRTSNDSVKVVWEVLRRLESLSASSRAAKVVRLVVFLSVELLGNFLSGHNTSMHSSIVSVDPWGHALMANLRSVGEILDDFRIVQERFAARSVVSIVRCDGRKAQAGGIRQAVVIDASIESTISTRQEASSPVRW